ncbi:hypothetical protein [Saccharopolyspora rosea]|uniref:hypothetical protein n=1 Tax=Saccharopolyspora rosea TaxID=524884 RepID=UPI0021D8FBE0|nr:hypothetical protein [Saccharopolyspora rosea]
MKIDSNKPATGATVAGWIILSLGILIWLVIVPLTASALLFASEITVEAGFATFGAVAFGIAGAIGFSAVAASEHRSARAALWIFSVLLLLAIADAIALHAGA